MDVNFLSGAMAKERLWQIKKQLKLLLQSPSIPCIQGTTNQWNSKTEGALHYYAININAIPGWSKDMKCSPIGKHLFCV